jgi:predicted NBD/HSP70 family sugar kinase
VITDEEGRKLTQARVNLVSMQADAVVQRIAEVAHDLVTAGLGLDLLSPRLCLGVELGGPVDAETGVVRFYVNSPHVRGQDDPPPYAWEEVDLVDRLQKATGCITVVENDAHAHAVYEQKHGVGRRSSSFALLLVRHGIGAGVVLNNQLLPIPAEVGHLTVWPDGRDCDCGNSSHVESRTGRRAIPAIVAEKTGLPGDSFEWAVGLANGAVRRRLRRSRPSPRRGRRSPGGSVRS